MYPNILTHNMKVMFSGGGTLGPVTPLIAVYEILKDEYEDISFLWVGTKKGPEKELIEQNGIAFLSISSGKARRYLSIWNIVDIFKIIIGFFQSIKLLWREQPDVCISAGGFVSVPLHAAAWLMGIPTWIHQQDFNMGLANYLMKPFAKQITTALESQMSYFPKRKTLWLGNPVRREVMEGHRGRAFEHFGLDEDVPVVFVTGGGTGSLRINQLMVEALPQLIDHCQIIHLSGKERPQELVQHSADLFPVHYHLYQFFTDEMKDAYAAADIVISRGGFGTLTEIAALSKVAIIIPKPGHQVENVKYLENKGAVVYIDEKTADGNYLAKIIKQLLHDTIAQRQLSHNLHSLLPRAKDKDILQIFERLVSR